MTREAMLRPGSLDKVARTVEVIMSTGAIVRRRGWISDFDEALPVERARLDRINSIGIVLDNHRTRDESGQPTSVLDTAGAVVPGSVRVAGSDLVGKLRFANTERGTAIMDLVGDEIIRSVSLGYDPDEYEETKPKDRKDGGTRSLLTPTAWEPYEVSFVQMPADAGAVVRSDSPAANRHYAVRSREENPMTEQTHATLVDEATIRREAARAATLRAIEITDAGQRFGMDAAFIRTLVEDDKVTLEAAKARILDAKAERDATKATSGQTQMSRGADEADKLSDAIGLALMHRSLGEADPRKVRAFDEKCRAEGRASEIVAPMTDETTRRLSRSRLIDVAEAFLRSRGIPTGSMSVGQIAEAALSYRGGSMMSTADFPNLLANTANKMLALGYSEVTSPWRDIGLARRLDRPDFKTFSMYRRAGAPGLARINEHGEIKRSGWADSGTPLTGQLKTAGVEVAFTRQMLINDDLNAFAQQNLGLGDSAIRWEDDYVITTILYGNPTLNDTVALFDSTRGNLSADVGTPDLASIITATRMFAAMTETIKDPANNAGTTTRKLSFQITGFLCAVSEKLTLDQILEPRFPDAASSKLPAQLQGIRTWQDNRLQIETSAPDVHFALSNRTALVYGGLTGDPSPRLSMQVTTGVDGVIWQLVHDWYCDVEDPKAIIRIPKS